MGLNVSVPAVRLASEKINGRSPSATNNNAAVQKDVLPLDGAASVAQIVAGAAAATDKAQAVVAQELELELPSSSSHHGADAVLRLLETAISSFSDYGASFSNAELVRVFRAVGQLNQAVCDQISQAVVANGGVADVTNGAE